MGKVAYIIVVADTIKRPFPGAASLVKLGVPLAVARRYQIARREMTAGLKRRIEAAKN